MSKHFHVRTCLGCGARAPQSTLLRVAVDRCGTVMPDRTGSAPGRGGYLHREVACWDRFALRKGSVRSLHRAMSRPERQELVARLRADSEV